MAGNIHQGPWREAAAPSPLVADGRDYSRHFWAWAAFEEPLALAPPLLTEEMTVPAGYPVPVVLHPEENSGDTLRYSMDGGVLLHALSWKLAFDREGQSPETRDIHENILKRLAPDMPGVVFERSKALYLRDRLWACAILLGGGRAMENPTLLAAGATLLREHAEDALGREDMDTYGDCLRRAVEVLEEARGLAPQNLFTLYLLMRYSHDASRMRESLRYAREFRHAYEHLSPAKLAGRGQDLGDTDWRLYCQRAGEWAGEVDRRTEEARAAVRMLLPAREAMREGREGDALALLSRYVRSNASDAEGWTDLAEAYRAAGAVDMAIAAQKKAAALLPHWHPGRFRFADWLASAGRFEEAEETLRDMLLQTRRRADVLHRLAALLLECGDIARAMECAEEMMRETPCRDEAFALFAEIARARGEPRYACLDCGAQSFDFALPAGWRFFDREGRLCVCKTCLARKVFIGCACGALHALVLDASRRRITSASVSGGVSAPRAAPPPHVSAAVCSSCGEASAPGTFPAGWVTKKTAGRPWLCPSCLHAEGGFSCFACGGIRAMKEAFRAEGFEKGQASGPAALK